MSQVEIKRGSDLPVMPKGKGAAAKMKLFGYRADTGETVNFPMADFISALEDGEYVPKLAGDLDISGNSNVAYNQTRAIETTGGDQDINSEKQARVVSVRGTEAGITASGAKIVAVGFNQLAPSGISGQTATFRAVASKWGEYGKSTENNGYLFTDDENNIVVPTSVKQNGSNVPTHTENGVVYYLPASDGNVVATFAAGVNVAKVCAHICWSNYRDTDYEAYTADEISLASVITSAGGTLRRVSNGAGYVYDEITFGDTAAEKMWVRRVGVVAAVKDLSWSMEEVSSGSDEGASTTYRFAAAVSGMKADGIFSVSGGSVSGFYTSGSVLMVESGTINSVAALKTALGTASMKYELATPVTGTHRLDGLITVDDFGTVRFEGGAAAVDFDMQYASYWRDVLKNMPQTIESEGMTTAMALAALAARIEGIEQRLSEGLPFLKVESLQVQRSMNGYPTGGNWMLQGTDSPTEVPDFIGQEYLDTTNKKMYKAFGVSAVTDWVLMN